jgi:methylphosphotriester-DNA--protein-cysteine methyltransferase
LPVWISETGVPLGWGPPGGVRSLRQGWQHERGAAVQRFVRMIDAAARPPDLASAAAVAGYADQAHLTRECSALSGLTPAALARVRHAAPA